MIKQKYIDLLRVEPGKKIHLKDYETGWAQTKDFDEIGKDKLKGRANEILQQNLEDLTQVQQLLYADDRYSLLIVFQAMDAAGKDGTIKHVMSGVNPQGCQVFSFKKPTSEDVDHNFLWRYMKSLPERGRIGIFNRSYYEDVLVVKVHPELLQNLPDGKRGKSFWEDRYEGRHQRIRTSPGTQRHCNTEIFPECLEKNAKRALHGAAGAPRKKLEIFGLRSC